MKKTVFLLSITALLSACGARVALTPKAGTALPMKAETAATQATPTQLMTPDQQARPKRSDELLRRSEERREDKFDLPPTG
jgi:Prokaryotic membrane lipoprotein lipid attachment site